MNSYQRMLLPNGGRYATKASLCRRAILSSVLLHKRTLICSGLILMVIGVLCSRGYSDIQTNEILKDKTFQGIQECGFFPCLGSDLCNAIDRNLLESFDMINVNHLSFSHKYRMWAELNGVLKHPHHPLRGRNCTIRIMESFLCNEQISSCSYDRIHPENVDEMKTGSLQAFRATLCFSFGRKETCNVTNSLLTWGIMDKVFKSNGHLTTKFVKGLSQPLQCATQRLVNRIVRRSSGNRNGRITLGHMTNEQKATLLFKIKMAPGSWMQEVFPAHEGWPLGMTYGACGRIIVHSRNGDYTLAQMFNKPWKIRVDLACQLLRIAFFLTDNDDRFLLLIHRLKTSDFKISASGQLRLSNSDQIIVVDKTDREEDKNLANKKAFYEVPYLKSHGAIDDNRICSYKENDVNFYAICLLLLGRHDDTNEGLLHHPREKEEINSEILVLLDICVRGSLAIQEDKYKFTTSPRIAAAKRLRTTLDSIRPCSPELSYRYPECEYARDRGMYLPLASVL